MQWDERRFQQPRERASRARRGFGPVNERVGRSSKCHTFLKRFFEPSTQPNEPPLLFDMSSITTYVPEILEAAADKQVRKVDRKW